MIPNKVNRKSTIEQSEDRAEAWLQRVSANSVRSNSTARWNGAVRSVAKELGFRKLK